MGAERREIDQEGHELRALLVRFLIEASPGDPRLAQVITAMDQVVKVARDGLEPAWKQDLATVKTDLGKVRRAVEDSSLLPQIKDLLAQSDSQLAVLLRGAEERSQAHLGRLNAVVSELTKRVQMLEAQVQKLTSGQTSHP